MSTSKQNIQTRMQKSLDALAENLAKIRTGRAHPSLLDHVHVSYYGTDTPISQVANITVADARTLAITPWEKSMTEAIDKAIRESDLGLNPVTAGDVIRVPLPQLNEERRKELVRVVRNEVETGRVSIRNIRRDILSEGKNRLKQKEITEDELRQLEDQVQKMTDQFIAKADEMLKAKEAELMEV
ncbi:MAG: ribosome recycling factor [Gammaproteobacteria bacterium]|nr:MAG: ribosome recycling factor [Gammaproteobacteria bacterium]